MPLFRKRPKSPPSNSPAFRSVEHLPQLVDRRVSVPTANLHQQHRQHQQLLQHQSPPPPHPLPVPPPYHHPAHSPSSPSLDRSQSQRQSDSDLPVAVPASPTAPPPRFVDVDPSDDDRDHHDHDDHDDRNQRRSIRNLFSLHSSATRDSTGPLERHRSLRRSSPASRRQRPLSVDTSSADGPPLTSRSREYVVESVRTTPQSPMPPPDLHLSSSQNPRLSRSPNPPSIPRANTDSTLLLDQQSNQQQYRPSPIDPPRHPVELLPGPPQQQPSLDPSSARPPSRQSIGPPSPLRPLPNHSTDASALPPQGMSERPSTGAPPGPATNNPPAYSQTPPSNNTNPSQGSEPGRSTPTSSHSRTRDEGEVDVRSLVQKHDELQAKYSKVKRYYFEKEAQVQHLQNTVAHQRMAVSRTVLDDNEYANRFGRLDGAIKDLAFSIRKDWKCLPPWLNGYVNEDAHMTGTKEMTAIGRAVMSRWLVDELFGRYFHPALEPSLGQQLKSIENNLRRQQGKTVTEEDKENAIARISNWRRTTLDGLEDALIGPAADENRVQLIDRLVESLVATLVTYLQHPPPPGLDNGARMIVENAIGISEKIPLESRDICVDYVLPGTSVHEPTMKLETGIPPLTSGAESNGTRGSGDQDRSDAPGPDEEDRDSSSGSTPETAPGREQRVRSVFSSLMGRRQGPSPSTAIASATAPATTPATAPATATAPSPGERSTSSEGARVRFSTFVMADVRGRGPVNVLVKAPVYSMD